MVLPGVTFDKQIEMGRYIMYSNAPVCCLILFQSQIFKAMKEKNIIFIAISYCDQKKSAKAIATKSNKTIASIKKFYHITQFYLS